MRISIQRPNTSPASRPKTRGNEEADHIRVHTEAAKPEPGSWRIDWYRVRVLRNIVALVAVLYAVFEVRRPLRRPDLAPLDLSRSPRRVERPLDFFQRLTTERGKETVDEWFYMETGEVSYRTGALKQKVAVVTGGSSGIGRAVAMDLVRRGATVVLTSRRLERAAAATEWMAQVCRDAQDGTCGVAVPMQLDLSDLDDVRRFAAAFVAKYTRLNYLVENAGSGPLLAVPLVPASLTGAYTGPWASKQGYEMLYAGNYLGHFLLLNLLLPLLSGSSEPRVTTTSSIAHWTHTANLTSLLPSEQMGSAEAAGAYAAWHQYGNTKLLQIHMCFELQRRLAPKGGRITVTPVAPGYISTAIAKGALERRDGVDGWLPLALSPDHGALTTLHALLSPSHRAATGVFLQPYYTPKHQDTPYGLGGLVPMLYEFLGQRYNWGLYRGLPHADAFDAAFAAELWEASARAVGVDGKV